MCYVIFCYDNHGPSFKMTNCGKKPQKYSNSWIKIYDDL